MFFLNSSVVKGEAALQSNAVRASDTGVHGGRFGIWADHELRKPDIALGLFLLLFQKTLGDFFNNAKHV